MTHDPTKGCYTLDTLRVLNPLYDHEHGLTQQDVEAVNAMKKYIEIDTQRRQAAVRRSGAIRFPPRRLCRQCIDRLRQKRYAHRLYLSLRSFHLADERRRAVQPRRRPVYRVFCLPHSAMKVPDEVFSKFGAMTDLAATGRSASRPKSRGGATANPIRSMATLRPRRGAGSMSIGPNGRTAAIFTARTAGRSATKQRSRRSCTTTKRPYFRDVRPGSWSSGATALRRDLCRRSSGMRSTRRSPIAISTTSRNP